MTKKNRDKRLKKRDISRRSIGILPPASRLHRDGWRDLDPSHDIPPSLLRLAGLSPSTDIGELEASVSDTDDHDKRKEIQRNLRRDYNRKFREGHNDSLGIFLVGKIPRGDSVNPANSTARNDCKDDRMSGPMCVGTPLAASTLELRDKIVKKRIRRAEIRKWKKQNKKYLEGKTRFEKIPIEGSPGMYRVHTGWGGPLGPTLE
ncbi:hypothetical protein YB2330_000310 [Saitoella coloradoensis]